MKKVILNAVMKFLVTRKLLFPECRSFFMNNTYMKGSEINRLFVYCVCGIHSYSTQYICIQLMKQQFFVINVSSFVYNKKNELVNSFCLLQILLVPFSFSILSTRISLQIVFILKSIPTKNPFTNSMRYKQKIGDATYL